MTDSITTKHPSAGRRSLAHAAAILHRLYDRGMLVWGLVIILAIQTAATSDVFLTSANLSNLAAQAVPIGLVALGQYIAILSGSIDLSVAAVAKLAALLTAGIAADSTGKFVPAMLVALAVGAVVGLINGLLIAWLNIDPLITTFITMTLVSGVALWYTKTPIGGIPNSIADFAYDDIGPIPTTVALLAITTAVVATVLQRTRAGRGVVAVGGDREVARRIGIQVSRTRIAAMVASGALAALGGVILVLRLGVGEPRAAAGFELNSIVAVVLGGVSIAGGRGTAVGVLGGVAFFGVLNNAFNLQDVDGQVQDLARGALILIAITLFSRRER